jgi:hypothetical protein
VNGISKEKQLCWDRNPDLIMEGRDKIGNFKDDENIDLEKYPK